MRKFLIRAALAALLGPGALTGVAAAQQPIPGPPLTPAPPTVTTQPGTPAPVPYVATPTPPTLGPAVTIIYPEGTIVKPQPSGYPPTPLIKQPTFATPTYIANAATIGMPPAPPPADGEPRPAPDGHALKRWLHRWGYCCWSHHNNVGCSSTRDECKFIFGSCRTFFSEPCFAGQPPFPGQANNPPGLSGPSADLLGQPRGCACP